MIDLKDIRATLVAERNRSSGLPPHVEAFRAWLGHDVDALRGLADAALRIDDGMRLPEHIAVLGFAAFEGLLSSAEHGLFNDEISHLGGRTFFAKGKTPRFEVDGIALLGVTLGVARIQDVRERQWLGTLLVRSSEKLAADPWQIGLVSAAQNVLGVDSTSITLPELAVAMWARGAAQEPAAEVLHAGWNASVSLQPHDSGPARDAVRLIAFDHLVARTGQVAIAGTTKQDLVRLLDNVSRSMRLWPFEEKPRTKTSKIARWEIENEYHVQSLLWVILSPLFADLEDEENLPSLGHKNPRADLCIPSLRTIIEVKFMRRSGQSACADIIEEISADTGLYLSKSAAYDSIIAFVWDNSAQTEQHHELKTGLEDISGVSAAIIIPRPSKM